MSINANHNGTKTNSKTNTRKPTQQERAAKRAKRIAVAWAIAIGVMIAGLAAIGFMGSWQHLRDLGVMAGGSARNWWGTANLTPVSVDLMLVIASIQLRRKGITPTARLIARLCSFAGLLVSVAGNVLVAWLRLPEAASGLQVGYTLIWAAMPVLSLLGAVEMLTHTHKDAKTVTRKATAPARPRAARQRNPQTAPAAAATPANATA